MPRKRKSDLVWNLQVLLSSMALARWPWVWSGATCFTCRHRKECSPWGRTVWRLLNLSRSKNALQVLSFAQLNKIIHEVSRSQSCGFWCQAGSGLGPDTHIPRILGRLFNSEPQFPYCKIVEIYACAVLGQAGAPQMLTVIVTWVLVIIHILPSRAQSVSLLLGWHAVREYREATANHLGEWQDHL